MKVFQIEADVCYWDATKQFSSVSSTIGYFPSNILFVEAPDYVFEGWGYNEFESGDARFIKPKHLEGWIYDENTGTFYPNGEIPEKTDVASEIKNVVDKI